MRLPYIFNTVYFLFGTKRIVDNLNHNSLISAKKNSDELTILLHGTCANYYRTMYFALKWLKKRGINAISLGYPPAGSIEDSAKIIKLQIEDILQKTKIKKINLVGFSLGGVVARYYCEKLGGKNILHKLVTIASPVHKFNTSNNFFMFILNIFGYKTSLKSIVTEDLKNNFSFKNYLAIYPSRDLIVGKQYPILNKKILQKKFSGGHGLISYNTEVLGIVLNYLNHGKL